MVFVVSFEHFMTFRRTVNLAGARHFAIIDGTRDGWVIAIPLLVWLLIELEL